MFELDCRKVERPEPFSKPIDYDHNTHVSCEGFGFSIPNFCSTKLLIRLRSQCDVNDTLNDTSGLKKGHHSRGILHRIEPRRMTPAAVSVLLTRNESF